jgi:hypothetical protein
MVSLKQQELAERERIRQSNEKMHSERMSLELEKLSQSTGLERDKLMTMLGISKFKEDNTNQRFNAELSTKQNMGTGI